MRASHWCRCTTSPLDYDVTADCTTDAAVLGVAATDATFTATPAATTQDIQINSAITQFPVTKNIMAGVLLNYNKPAILEVDTAACHNVISYSLYQDIVALSNGKPPVLEKCNVIMKLADGTPSDNVKGCVQLSISLADIPNRSAVLPVFVVEGQTVS